MRLACGAATCRGGAPLATVCGTAFLCVVTCAFPELFNTQCGVAPTAPSRRALRKKRGRSRSKRSSLTGWAPLFSPPAPAKTCVARSRAHAAASPRHAPCLWGPRFSEAFRRATRLASRPPPRSACVRFAAAGRLTPRGVAQDAWRRERPLRAYARAHARTTIDAHPSAAQQEQQPRRERLLRTAHRPRNCFALRVVPVALL